MIDFITANLGTIIVALIVAGLLAAIIIKAVKDKRSGKSSCSCGCKDCANAEFCHGRKPQN